MGIWAKQIKSIKIFNDRFTVVTNRTTVLETVNNLQIHQTQQIHCTHSQKVLFKAKTLEYKLCEDTNQKRIENEKAHFPNDSSKSME